MSTGKTSRNARLPFGARIALAIAAAVLVLIAGVAGANLSATVTFNRATASLNINGCFAVRGVKLMEGSNGLFVSMPGQINSKGEIKDICFPYTREARAELESAVVTAYQQALTQGMNRSPQSAPDPTAQQAQKMGM